MKLQKPKGPRVQSSGLDARNSIAFSNARRRQAESQPITQSGRQSISQADNQASRQEDRQFDFCSFANYDYKHRGTWGVQEHSVVEWSNTRQTNRRQSRPAGLADHRLSQSATESLFILDPGSNPSNHKLLTSQPQKMVSSMRGIEVSKSKNPLGDCFVGQNLDFTRGWTSNIMPWGMQRE